MGGHDAMGGRGGGGGGGGESDMEEEDEDNDDRGVMPRAIDAIFRHLDGGGGGGEGDLTDNRTSPPSSWRIFVSFVEIYLENLRDLLDLEIGKEIHIREDDAGNTLVCGATERQCETKDEVVRCLVSGTAIRHTSATNMNELSSRSHTVFTITLDQRIDDGSSGGGSRGGRGRGFGTSTGTWLTSKFHFVDLAGSERVNKTGNVGERFKESIQINSGLLALGNVISALGNATASSSSSSKQQQQHIPYRESKVTRILKVIIAAFCFIFRLSLFVTQRILSFLFFAIDGLKLVKSAAMDGAANL